MKKLRFLLVIIAGFALVSEAKAQLGTGNNSDMKVPVPVITPQATPGLGVNAVNVPSTFMPAVPSVPTLSVPAISPIPSLPPSNLLPAIPATPDFPPAPPAGALPPTDNFTTTLNLPYTPILPPVPPIPPMPPARLPITGQ